MIQKAHMLGKISKERTVDENTNQKKVELGGSPEVVPVPLRTIYRVRGYDEYDDGFKEELYDEFHSNQDEARKAFERYVNAYFVSATRNISPDDWSLTESDPPRAIEAREGRLAVFCGTEEDDICYHIILSEIKLL